MTDVQSQTACVCVYVSQVELGRQYEGERISQKVTKRSVSTNLDPHHGYGSSCLSMEDNHPH